MKQFYLRICTKCYSFHFAYYRHNSFSNEGMLADIFG